MQFFIIFLISLTFLAPSTSLHIQNHFTVNRDLEQLQKVVEMKTEAID